MEEILFANILKTIGLIAGITGVLIGLDLIFGAPVITTLKRALEKSFDFDKVIVNPKLKRGLGIVFLVFSLIILLLITRI